MPMGTARARASVCDIYHIGFQRRSAGNNGWKTRKKEYAGTLAFGAYSPLQYGRCPGGGTVYAADLKAKI